MDREIYVHKFGGSALRDVSCFSRLVELLKEMVERGEEFVVVISAVRGLTDWLLDMAEDALSGMSEEQIGERVEGLKNYMLNLCSQMACEEARKRIESLSRELEKILIGIRYVGELSPRSRDLVASFGERMTLPLVVESLEKSGLKVEGFEGGDAGIITNEEWGNAKPILDLCEREIRSRLLPVLDQGEIPVVCGFIGKSVYGAVTTLGRGGSDYTASIIGYALRAKEIVLWKDVIGIMSANPKFTSKAKKIKELSYKEAAELAYFGSKVLHPRAIEPAMMRDIPIRVRSFFNLEDPGTLIRRRTKQTGAIKAISVRENIGAVTIYAGEMIESPGFLGSVATCIGRRGIDLLITPTGLATITLTMDDNDVEEAVEALEKELGDKIERLEIFRNRALVAIIGEGIEKTPGVAARVFGALGKAGINIEAISASTESGIYLLVREDDVNRCVDVLHEEFFSS